MTSSTTDSVEHTPSKPVWPDPPLEGQLKTFNDVMDWMPHEVVRDLLNNPRPIDRTALNCMWQWCRPKQIESETFIDAAVECGMFASRGEVYRKLKERALKWNGSQVSDANQPITFVESGWGVIQLGRKTHEMVLSTEWIVRKVPQPE